MLVGLLGHPLEHSLSPSMQNRAMEELNIKGKYLLFDVLEEELEKTVKGLFTLGAAGFNVTIPYKKKIIGLLDGITPKAQEIGAVNLVYRQEQGGKVRYIGDNSDASGFVMSLRKQGLFLRSKKVLVLGNGGAARAVASGLKDNGCKVTIAARKRSVGFFWQQFGWEQLSDDLVLDVDFVVNCTSVGMYPNEEEKPVVNPALYPKTTVFCDIVYNPLNTKLIQIAKTNGLKTITGDGMLLYQGAISFERWFGKKAPVQVMKGVLDTYLKEGGQIDD